MASCIPAELSAIPREVRRGPTISGTIACRVGMSIAIGAALRKASRKISAKPSASPEPTLISSATVSAIRNPNPCAASSSRRRSKRSASAPASRLKTSAPIPRRLPRTPIRMIRESSSALSCTQKISETTCRGWINCQPTKLRNSSRKSRTANGANDDVDSQRGRAMAGSGEGIRGTIAPAGGCRVYVRPPRGE